LRGEGVRLRVAGYARYKIPFGEDAALDEQRVRALRALIGPDAQLGLDASGVFDNIKDALAAWRKVEPYGIDFLEDPFPASEWALANELAKVAPVRIAFGESLTSPQTMQQLTVDILRPDATVQHGVTGFLQGIAPGLERHAQILPHYYPDIHAPLAGALGLMAVEESPALADTVGFGVLRATQPDIRGGLWHLSERPGFGVDWDEDAIARCTVRG
jgi:L-alanine-DL-glutamate epimerase-like enolase superfamily enzyme